MSIAIDLSGQVVLVTGGTRGIGRAIAARFLDAGASVVVCGRTAPDSLPNGGGGCSFLSCDVRDADAVAGLVSAVIDKHGRLDVLVNNAGGSPPVDTATASPRFSASIVDLNLTAALHCAQAANGAMQVQEGGGVIVNIASVAGLQAAPTTAAYGAAKAGLLNLTATLAVEWAPKVRVNALAPGAVQTELTAQHFPSEAALAEACAAIPMGRMATPRDVADAAVFLASPLAAYLNGAILRMDGGGG
jgi:NAD(P)-dependent dehydrogenase (short-subunit alcohol dehydrogenase family)